MLLIMTDDYNDSLSVNNNCTIDEKNIEIFKPTLIVIIPCGLSFLSLMSLMVYTLIKHLFKNKWWRSFFTHLILLGVQ